MYICMDVCVELSICVFLLLSETLSNAEKVTYVRQMRKAGERTGSEKRTAAGGERGYGNGKRQRFMRHTQQHFYTSLSFYISSRMRCI